MVIAEAHNGRQAVELCLHYRPDVVLMDVVMPELDGIAATRRIVKEIPEQIVVILTSADDDEIGLLGLRAGAVGLPLQGRRHRRAPAALRGALDGRGRDLAAAQHARSSSTSATRRRDARHAAGQEPADPARVGGHRPALRRARRRTRSPTSLVLSTETVRSHVKNILRKLDARSREEAVAIAQRMRSG